MPKAPHVLVIHNPVSGAKKWRNVSKEVCEALEENGCTWTWVETELKQRQDFSSLKALSFDRVLVLGGDGTISEVVDFLLKENKKVPVQILPQGSANVLGWSLNLPLVLDLKRKIKKGLTAKAKIVDAFHVNRQRHGLIAVGRGYDAFLMQETDRPLKRRLGPFAYAWTALKTFLFYRSQPYKITIDKNRFFVSAKLVMVVNLLPVPRFLVKNNDGLLNVFIVTHRHRLQMWSGKNIVIKSKADITFELDGEVQKAKTLQVEVLPNAVQVVS